MVPTMNSSVNATAFSICIQLCGQKYVITRKFFKTARQQWLSVTWRWSYRAHGGLRLIWCSLISLDEAYSSCRLLSLQSGNSLNVCFIFFMPIVSLKMHHIINTVHPTYFFLYSYHSSCWQARAGPVWFFELDRVIRYKWGHWGHLLMQL